MTRAGDQPPVQCPLCGDARAWPVPWLDSDEARAARSATAAGKAPGWRLCRRCANAYPERQPDRDALARIWALNRSLEGADPADADQRSRYRIEIARIGGQRALEIYGPLAKPPPGRMLDVGCGLGETVRTFASAGWEALGIDPDPSVKAYHQSIGIRSLIGQFEAIDLDRPYDVVHIAHAIYFVTEPRRMLDRVRALLADDGLLCITLADFTHWLDPNLPGYEHTFFPTPASMRAALAIAGFRTLATRRLKSSAYLACSKSEPHELSPSPLLHWLHWHSKRARFGLVGAPALTCYRLLRGARRT